MKVRDLRPREQKDIVLSCAICGAIYSAHADDYTGTVQTIGLVDGVHVVKNVERLYPDDKTLSCCAHDLERVKFSKRLVVDYEPA